MQRVSMPRIYVDYSSYIKELGIFKSISYKPKSGGSSSDVLTTSPSNDNQVFDLSLWNVLGLNPSNIYSVEIPYTGFDKMNFVFKYNTAVPLNTNVWYGILGHNLSSSDSFIWGKYIDGDNSTSWIDDMQDIINSDIENGVGVGVGNILYDGFSIAIGTKPIGELVLGSEFELEIYDMDNLGRTLNIGSLCFGNYYDFPNAADLQLTQTYEMDGITHQTTKGGVRLSDVKYRSAPKWGELGAWELQSYAAAGHAESWSWDSQLNARSGRRSWDLSFSYISDTDMFPTTSLGGGVITDPDAYGSNMGIIVIGDNLWDADASTFEGGSSIYSWTAYGTNTFSNDGNALKLVTPSGGNPYGGQVDLNNAADLSTDLTPQVWYRVMFDAKINESGSPRRLRITNTVNGTVYSQDITETSFTENFFDFQASSATGHILSFDGASTTEDSFVWIDNLKLYELSSAWSADAGQDMDIAGTETDNTLLSSDDFISAVWNRTLGGRLPFIFQPDKDNANPDQFAICKFDQDTLDIQRVAFNTYTIKLKIREVW